MRPNSSIDGSPGLHLNICRATECQFFRRINAQYQFWPQCPASLGVAAMAKHSLFMLLPIRLRSFTGTDANAAAFYTLPIPGWYDKSAETEDLDPRFYAPDGELIALPVLGGIQHDYRLVA